MQRSYNWEIVTSLLAVDIGNSNITIGAFDDQELTATWRLATRETRTVDEHAWALQGVLRSKGVEPDSFDAVVICSVVPPLTEAYVDALAQLTTVEPLVIGPGVRTGIRIHYDRTQDVGADRIVDAVAAHQLYGGPLVVVDIGTATVFDAVTADGDYIGGAISPGMEIAADAMFRNTSLLRRVELIAPDQVIGRSTVASMQSGFVYGFAELIEGMLARFKMELNPDAPEDVTVVATGGLANLIAEHTESFNHVNPELTLVGLRLVHEMNNA
ncbi:type III pantothenate kinase [Candidatus Lucifugimonas marina]|uniref:Type III pantothenate kinase n=1 Tax=Candidatus Lucifugimonas marina TaxID=3038979 RepID=A0AAJ6CSA3_9CHLR|nr:type III pantothenate kinase [SAR202 cluster bacterium JH702]MDG0868478.1 type III pantothenate kinase [SAR202 cluster bacterium JH639]WFG35111.1 type III pantothenate kinase [SAR202 cluster bacterium JH545]WFG39068.1 type III pantothenate kinase [SAR202 cluster bacterium JH1073]